MFILATRQLEVRPAHQSATPQWIGPFNRSCKLSTGLRDTKNIFVWAMPPMLAFLVRHLPRLNRIFVRVCTLLGACSFSKWCLFQWPTLTDPHVMLFHFEILIFALSIFKIHLLN